MRGSRMGFDRWSMAITKRDWQPLYKPRELVLTCSILQWWNVVAVVASNQTNLTTTVSYRWSCYSSQSCRTLHHLRFWLSARVFLGVSFRTIALGVGWLLRLLCSSSHGCITTWGIGWGRSGVMERTARGPAAFPTVGSFENCYFCWLSTSWIANLDVKALTILYGGFTVN